ncbi:hypothetical protein [Roseibium aggregatum]|uniref:Uncharacterized protein n=1 Tax=Roseibium aggregatum TaxID=187304 RepID=A0A0M6YF61_9HYPH|nr:hypothetical protein [Roseibium aggregatum]CTQ47460.1 hypothetical protein LAL4801_05922 [Roseibium aggregatum]
MSERKPGDPLRDWIAARTAEIDAALEVVETHSARFDTRMQRQTDNYYTELKAARDRIREALSAAITQGRATSLPQLTTELTPLWNSYEHTLELWAETCNAQDETIGAQMNAQAKVWNGVFEAYKSSLMATQEAVNAALIDRIGAAQRQKRQDRPYGSSGHMPWGMAWKTMEETREAAEAVAADIQTTLEKYKS